MRAAAPAVSSRPNAGEDLRAGTGSVELPAALERRYPRAVWEWNWQWVFPATRHYVGAESVLQRGRARGGLEVRPRVRTIQELLGHRHVTTTMIYTHVLNRGGRGVRSPRA